MREILDTSINLELRIADIYKIHYDLFEEDKEFWWKLVIEEESHAALLRSGKEHYLPANSFPEKILSPSINRLLMSDKLTEEYMGKLKLGLVSREIALNTAYHFENMVGELNFQIFMIKNTDEKLERIFQVLNQDSVDHAQRILNYMSRNGIPVLESEEVFSY